MWNAFFEWVQKKNIDRRYWRWAVLEYLLLFLLLLMVFLLIFLL